MNPATFQRDYPGIESVLSDILFPVFGETKTLKQDVITKHGLSRQAADAKIEKITRIAEYYFDGAPLNIFDVQLASDVNLSHSRVNIKRLLVSKVDVFSSSLIFFHYGDARNREWRISYFAKGRGNTDTTAAKRYTFLCGKSHGCRTVAERFELLRREPDKTRAALTKVFSVETLNKEFYQKLANWFFWALRVVRFPEGETDPEKNAVPLIRLITRVIFVWFMRKKHLVPDQLFDRGFVNSILKPECDESAYYRAILQNLFFATLNTEQTDSEARKFRNFARYKGRNEQYHIYSVYRYEDFFTDDGKARFLELMRDIPFLNGGLFSCLDDNESNTPVDAFSDQAARRKLLSVPDELFWTTEEEHRRVDLSEAYGDTSHSSEPVLGLVTLLDQYNFTVDESSRDEATVALDPELLGVVFENLLASYNPETKTTARKQTGSFYTPREIVDYMVEESLIRYLLSCGIDGVTEDQLRTLVAEDTLPSISAAQKRAVIDALKSCRVLDPACGSGAFPMGLLQISVRILDRLDPVGSFEELYERKLHLIRNCIYGVDIQPIAVQISKLRCFISLLADSEIDDRKLNRGIEPLPNLEMHFVAANSLLDIDLSAFDEWTNDPVLTDLTSRIGALRDRFFAVKRYTDKKALRQQDRALRNDLRQQLIRLANGGNAAKIEYLNGEIAKLQQERTKYLEPNIQELAPHEEDEGLLDFARPDRSDSLRIDVNAAKRDEIDSRIRRCQAALKKESRVDDQAVYDEATKLADWNPFDQMATAPFFNPKWMFGHDGSFDIVIGNPPYVRADNPDADYQAERTAIKASGMYETLYEKWDLFIAFLERGYQLLAENGVETFIVSDAYCHAKYALRSQAWFLRHARIPRIDFCGDLKIFEAAVHNVIPFFEKADGADNTPLRRLHTEKFGNVTDLPTDIQTNLDPRSTFFPQDPNAAAQVELPGIPLGDICYITYGLRPSSDEDDPDEPFTTENLISTTRDAIHCQKYVEGKHLSPWIISQWLWLEWGTERAPGRFCRKTFPELYQIREKILAQRSPGPDPIISFDSRSLIFTPACVGFVLWNNLRGVRNKSIKKSARYDDETPKRDDLPRREDLEETSQGFNIRYLLAVMNSTPAREFLRANRRSNIHLYPDDWKRLPIPEATPEQQRPIIALVDQILALKQRDPSADITVLESELDTLVSELYGVG